MKVRLTARRVRVRIDDLELGRLQAGETLTLSLGWSGGGWTLSLEPGLDGVLGEGAHLRVGLRGQLPELADPAREGVQLTGDAVVDVEKDFGPQHA